MAEPARHHLPDDEAVPEPVSHDEKTLEMPAIPEPMPERDTVPVRSSLGTLLRHEMLRHQSATDDAGER